MTRVNQSCLTADIWLGQSAVIQYKSDQRVNLTNYDTRQSGARGRKRVAQGGAGGAW